MFTFWFKFLQPLIKEFSATSLNWDTAHTTVSFAFSSLVLERKKPECSQVEIIVIIVANLGTLIFGKIEHFFVYITGMYGIFYLPVYQLELLFSALQFE